MRWVFLLLVMLNGLYYVWHQQEAPLRPKEVAPLSLYKGGQQNIRLLSESASGSQSASKEADSQCIYLGGVDISPESAKTIEQRLTSLDIQARSGRVVSDSVSAYWVRVAPESRRLVDDALVGRLRQDFPQIKSKIMSCESIATSE